MLVEGDAGIGKTRLLTAIADEVRAAGLPVHWASSTPLEQEFSFGVARQLFGEEVVDRPTLLSGSAALAGHALGTLTPQTAAPDSAYPVVHGLWRLAAELAAGGRRVLVVDDAHWTDAPSLRFVDFLARRLRDVELTVILAVRTGGGAAAIRELLASIREAPATTVVRPRPLSGHAAGGVIRAGTGASAAPAFIEASVISTGGNPFRLHALAEELRATGITPSADACAWVGTIGLGAVEQSLRRRLAALPPEATVLAEALSVIGQADGLRLPAAVAELPFDQASQTADLLSAAGIIAPTRPLRFTHPIDAHSVYASLPHGLRDRLHRRAAHLLAADDAPPAMASAHLLACEPAGDTTAAALLLRAGGAALRQGAGPEAVRYLERALREPPAVDQRAPILGALGRAVALDGRDFPRARQHFEAAAQAAATARERAEYLEDASRVQLWLGDVAGAIALLDCPFEHGPVDRETELRLRAHQAAAGILAPGIGRAAIDRLERDAGEIGTSPAALAVLAERAGAHWLRGELQPAADLAERAIAGGHLLAAEGPMSVAFSHAIHVLLDADRFDTAGPALAHAIAVATEQGASVAAGSLIALQAVGHWRRGDVPACEAAAREALARIGEAGGPMAMPAQRGYLTLALVARGELALADAESERSGLVPELLELSYCGTPFDARARLRLAQGRPTEARDGIRALEARDARLELRHLSTPWHRTAVAASLACGDRATAIDYAERFVDRARTWSTPSAIGQATATLGLALGDAQGLRLLEEGAALLASSPARLEHACALVDLGAAQRRAGRRTHAREHLSAGLDIAVQCGATLLARHAIEELSTTGARPRRVRTTGPAALTPGERRVAELAAAGRSNREIASALHLAVRTVENHLAHTYAKLDIGSRQALADALVDHADALATKVE